MTGKPQERRRARGPQARRAEPPSFAWTEPLVELPDPEPQVIEAPRQLVLVGHRPGLGERVGEFRSTVQAAMPSPMAAAAGVAVLLSSLVGVAMIAPSGEQATAARSGMALVQSQNKPEKKPDVSPMTGRELEGTGDASRDPFAVNGYQAPALKKAVTSKKGKSKKSDAKAKSGSKKRPVSQVEAFVKSDAPGSNYIADFVFYSSDMPWSSLRRKRGTWLDVSGQPTLKFVSVDSKGADIFVVSDVEVLEGQGRRKAKYQYPTRMLRIESGGIVRFADYRDTEGQDVTYTLRYAKSDAK